MSDRAKANPGMDAYAVARHLVSAWMTNALHASTREAIGDDEAGQLVDTLAWKIDGFTEALRLVLMFYAPPPWTDAQREEWKRITGADEATTKVMCDHIRKVANAARAAESDEVPA